MSELPAPKTENPSEIDRALKPGERSILWTVPAATAATFTLLTLSRERSSIFP
jgi:hypothetical protein